MKFLSKSLPLVLATSALMASSLAMAQSQYGYNAAGSTVTAQAGLKVTVNVPSLILLRVGTAGAAGNEIVFTSTPSIPSTPTTPTDGSNTTVDWDGTAPTFTTTNTGDTAAAMAWTNAAAGGKVTCAVTTPFSAASQLLSTHILVSATTVAGGGLAHPGTDTSCSGSTSFARNTLVSSSWTYSITAAGMAAASPGSNSQIITYTATTL